MRKYTWLAAGLVMGGVGCIFGGVALFLEGQTFLQTAAVTAGTVTRGGSGGDKAGPGPGILVSFTLEDGSEEIVGLDPQSSYRRGDSVRLAYQPSNPDQARICTFWEMNLGPACLLTIGILLGGAGIFCFVAAPSRRGTRACESFSDLPGEILADPRVAEAFARDPGFSKHVHVSHQEHIEIEDAVTGQKRVYSSFDEVPPGIQAKLDALRGQMYAKATGASGETYTFRDELTGEERTYHSLDEMPRHIRRFFENGGRPGAE